MSSQWISVEERLPKYPGADIFQVDGRLYFRYDTGDSTTQDNEDFHRDIQRYLNEQGWEIEPPVSIEHDCISGLLRDLTVVSARVTP